MSRTGAGRSLGNDVACAGWLKRGTAGALAGLILQPVAPLVRHVQRGLITAAKSLKFYGQCGSMFIPKKGRWCVEKTHTVHVNQ